MATHRAKILAQDDFKDLIAYVHATSKEPLRDTVALVLFFKGGLRCCEVVGLDWRHVLDVRGEIGVRDEDNPDSPALGFMVPDSIAKGGSGRFVPLHPLLLGVLRAWRAHSFPGGVVPTGPVVVNRRGKRIKANTLQQYVRRLGLKFGMVGFSSHSGRRTFITNAARKAAEVGCSIRDVQKIVGHRQMATTEVYIGLSGNAHKLVGLV